MIPRFAAERAVMIAATIALGAVAHPLRGQESIGLWAAQPGPLVAEIRSGIDAYYGFEYSSALRAFERVVEARPNHPIGYFLRAEAYWWLYLNDRRNAAVLTRLESNLERAIDLGHKRLKRRPNDPETLFVLGSAYGRRGLLAGTRHEALRAARDAQRAKKHLSRMRRVAPGVVDAVTAEGLYQYYVARFGTVIRTASRLLFGLKGDREAGLASLDRARREGVYTRIEAAFFQGLFYLQFENRPAEALVILDRLRRDYPGNLYFSTMAAYAHQRRNELDAARELYEQTLGRIASSRVYGAEGETLTRYFYGQILIAQGELSGARSQFEAVVALRVTESDSYPHAILFLGRLADLEGRRGAARQRYRAVLDLPDVAGSHTFAKRYLDRGFTASEIAPLVGIASGR